jgi:hypothetical protein
MISRLLLPRRVLNGTVSGTSARHNLLSGRILYGLIWSRDTKIINFTSTAADKKTSVARVRTASTVCCSFLRNTQADQKSRFGLRKGVLPVVVFCSITNPGRKLKISLPTLSRLHLSPLPNFARLPRRKKLHLKEETSYSFAVAAAKPLAPLGMRRPGRSSLRLLLPQLVWSLRKRR